MVAKRVGTHCRGDRSVSLLTLTTDLADPSLMAELARSVLIDRIDANDEMNERLGADAGRFTEDPALPDRFRVLDILTLVRRSKADPRPAWFARQVADLLPNAQFRLIPRAGHFP